MSDMKISSFNFTLEADDRGFAVNCDSDGELDTDMIPEVLLRYVRHLCKASGLSFEKVLRSSLQDSIGQKIPEAQA